MFWGLPGEFWREHVRSRSIPWWHVWLFSGMPQDRLMKGLLGPIFEAIYLDGQRHVGLKHWILQCVRWVEAGLTPSAEATAILSAWPRLMCGASGGRSKPVCPSSCVRWHSRLHAPVGSRPHPPLSADRLSGDSPDTTLSSSDIYNILSKSVCKRF